MAQKGGFTKDLIDQLEPAFSNWAMGIYDDMNDWNDPDCDAAFDSLIRLMIRDNRQLTENDIAIIPANQN